MKKFLTVAAAGSLLAGCADAPTTTEKGFEGPGVEIQMAALNLQGVGDVVWDLQVVNGAAPTAQTVWQQRISSSQYGDSAGSASYVGPCDADQTANVKQNTVKVWVVGVYNRDVTTAEAGGFNADVAAAADAAEVPFQNPTWLDTNDNGVRDAVVGALDIDTPLNRVFTCVENQDVFVQFDVALMRPAQQGFFDIAVNFNNIFCSAKFDCSYPDNTNQPADADTNRDPINLLHDGSGGRNATHILGFACTAGADTSTSNKVTELYMDDLELWCGADGGDADTLGDDHFFIHPSLTLQGTLCTAGFTTCNNINTTGAQTWDGTLASTVADDYLFQAAVYSGSELLDAGVGLSYNKQYWNIALGVKPAAKAAGTFCQLVTKATADNSANTNDNVDGGIIAAGTVYPYVTFNVNFNTCAAQPLEFGNPTAMVGTAYTTTGGAQLAFDHQSN